MQPTRLLIMIKTKIGIGIFLRDIQSINDLDNDAEKVRNKLNFEGLRTFIHTKGSNYIFLELIDKKDLSEKVKEIDKLGSSEYEESQCSDLCSY